MKKSTIFGTLAIMAMAVTGAGYAQAYHGGDYGYHHRSYHHQEYRHGGCGSYEKFHHNYRGNCFYNGQEQNLTEEQLAKLGEMRENHFKTMKPLFDELRLKRMELDVFRDNPNVKTDQLDKLIKDIIVLENKIDSEKHSFRTQVKNEFGIEFGRPMRPMPAPENPDEE